MHEPEIKPTGIFPFNSKFRVVTDPHFFFFLHACNIQYAILYNRQFGGKLASRIFLNEKTLFFELQKLYWATFSHTSTKAAEGNKHLKKKGIRTVGHRLSFFDNLKI